MIARLLHCERFIPFFSLLQTHLWWSLQAGQQQQYGLMQDCQAHMAVVEAQAGAVFHSCFQLLSHVSEVDSMVRVLHLVTVMLEALGPKAQPHFAAITAALPQVSSNTLL